jgi:hypothetical protein
MADSNLDVSKEEERFLRRAFRRFAWPYLLASLLALGLGAGSLWVVQTGAGAGQDASESEALIAESASLRDALASLRQELDARGEQTGTLVKRLDALDRGFAEVTAGTSANMEGRLEAAHQRINALEARLAASAGDGLVGRLAKLESRLQQLEQLPPAPAAAAPSPRIMAPSPEPWPPASPGAP